MKRKTKNKTFFFIRDLKKEVKTIVSSIIQTGGHGLSVLKLSDFCDPLQTALVRDILLDSS